MKIDTELLREARQAKHWSQEELAAVSGLHRRTIQRIERGSNASLESATALAAALGIDVRDLGPGTDPAKSCPHCGSTALYQYDSAFETAQLAGELLPKLGLGIFTAATVRPVVCADCGLVRLFASDAATKRMRASEHWTST
jgi:transcriptional regulator with XRE-family HTH domain